MVRIRIKKCDRCETVADILYRIKVDRSPQWQFICHSCHQLLSSSQPDYIYGGTWKSRK